MTPMTSSAAQAAELVASFSDQRHDDERIWIEKRIKAAETTRRNVPISGEGSPFIVNVW